MGEQLLSYRWSNSTFSGLLSEAKPKLIKNNRQSIFLHTPFKTVINSILSARAGSVVQGVALLIWLVFAHNLLEHHPDISNTLCLPLKVTGTLQIYLVKEISLVVG